MKQSILSESQIAEFSSEGFLILEGFYDVKLEVEPIQYSIYQIIGILLEKYGVEIDRAPFAGHNFDSGYQELIAKDRKLGAVVYDAVKHIPAFVRLCCCEKHDRLMSALRETDLPAIPSGGSGIRIDNPFEDKFRANWHQDYPSQLRSLDGLIFWSPLISMTKDLGPLQVAVGSHRDGLFPFSKRDPENSEKSGAYGLRLHNEHALLDRYRIIEAKCDPGDLLVIDYLNLHASGKNTANRSRWSMQMRYFNFREPTGISYDWVGSFAAGQGIEDVHPEIVSD